MQLSSSDDSEDSEADVSSSSKESESENAEEVEQDKELTRGGWTIDPRERGRNRSYGPRLNMDSLSDFAELDFFLHFLPQVYMREVMIPSTNRHAGQSDNTFRELTFSELLHFFGLLYSMESYQLPERRMYWREDDNYPICAPTTRDCWTLHVQKGMPLKRRFHHKKI